MIESSWRPPFKGGLSPLKKKYIYIFNWRIIALHRIVLFSVKPQHESAIGTHMSSPSWTSLPRPSPSHSSGGGLTTKSCLILVTPWTRLFCPWNFPGKNVGVGCRFLLYWIFPTQGSNQSLLHCRQIIYPELAGKPLGCCRVPVWVPWDTANSHWLSILHMVM